MAYNYIRKWQSRILNNSL